MGASFTPTIISLPYSKVYFVHPFTKVTENLFSKFQVKLIGSIGLSVPSNDHIDICSVPY